MVESGEFAPSIGITGYPNGAGIAYGLYAATVALVAWLVARTSAKGSSVALPLANLDAKARRIGFNLLAFDTIFLLIFLFGFGAIHVWLGSVNKGEFRTSLGTFGAFPNLMTKFVVPTLLAYATLMYLQSSRSKSLKRLLTANFAVAFIIGGSWGFKSTAFIILAPSLIFIYWKIRLASLIKLGLIASAVLLFFFHMFDDNISAGMDAFEFLFKRVTVIQGDVAWYIWDQYVSGITFPDYLPTLTAAIGDKLLTFLLGITSDDYYRWAMWHYHLMVTYLAGIPLEQIEDGHTITATPFAEGLVAGGLAGVALFSVIGGLLAGGMYKFIATSLHKGRNASAALGATYFCFYIFGWLNGGAIVQLFHISLLVGIGSIYLAFYVVRSMRLKRPGPNRPSIALVYSLHSNTASK